MAELDLEVKNNIARYAGGVLVNRALCDSRDMLKPSTRTLMYSQIKTTKNLYNKPYMKCARVVGDAIGIWYTHGDASCYAIYARLSKPFAMRYPLEDFHGNYGTIKSSGNEAAMRYTEIRLGPLGERMFDVIEKETVSDWELNFDETEQYPRVCTSRGFYNIVNGTTGIGYGAASQIPQFNLKEVNEALIKLLWNPDINDREIICIPDFATGAILLNKDEVVESLLNGTGSACKLRSVIEYDAKTKTLKVTEIPYGVYTETIIEQIGELVRENPSCGIEGINDMSARTPDIAIYLSKNANPDYVLKLLYKNTSLQYFSGINMTMLKDGRVPKVFTWKEALQSYLDHQKIVYTKAYNFDLTKIKARLNIVEGLVKATSIIDEIIGTIKSSSDSKIALKNLQEKYGFNEPQAKAILDIKLSKLTKLDINKLLQEKESLNKEKNRIEEILADEIKFKKEIEKDLREVAEKFGDARRTKVLNIDDSDDDKTPSRALNVSTTNFGNYYATETSTLYTQKRGGVGAKFKFDKGEYIISSTTVNSKEELILLTDNGKYYHVGANRLELNAKASLYSLIPFTDGEQIKAAIGISKNSKPYLLIATEQGMIKKTELSDYNLKKGNGNKAIELNTGDKVVSGTLIKDEKIGLLSQFGNFVIVPTSDMQITGRTTKGVHGIKLNDGDSLISARPIDSDAKEIVSITGDGFLKRTAISEFGIQNRNTKGAKVQKFSKGDWTADFVVVNKENDLLITATSSCIKLKVEDAPLLSKDTLGNKAIKLAANDNVVKIEVF